MDRTTTPGPAQPRRVGGHAPPPPSDTQTTPGRAAAAAVVVALVVALTALVGPWDPEDRLTTRAPDEPLPTPEPVVEPSPDPLWEIVENLPEGQTRDLTAIGLVLLALVLGLVAWLVLRVARRLAERRRGEGAPDAADLIAGGVVGGADLMPDLPALREGVDDAGELLRSDRPPADAVIAAWVSLEGAAATSGVVRSPAQTPTEFTVTVLDRTEADPTAVRTLLDLYLRARFGQDPLSADDVAAASGAVRLLAEGLVERDPDPHAGDGPDEHRDPEGPS